MERRRLLGMRIERFVSKKERDALYLYLRNAHDKAPPSRTFRPRSIPPRRWHDVLRPARHAGRLSPHPRRGGYRVVIADVTALYAAEESLKFSERRFRA